MMPERRSRIIENACFNHSPALLQSHREEMENIYMGIAGLEINESNVVCRCQSIFQLCKKLTRARRKSSEEAFSTGKEGMWRI